MMSSSFRRRLGLATSAALLVGGFGIARHATAEPAPAPVEPVNVTVDDDYWACLALDYVEVGTCLENPLPDLSGYPTVPDLVRRVLSGLPV